MDRAHVGGRTGWFWWPWAWPSPSTHFTYQRADSSSARSRFVLPKAELPTAFPGRRPRSGARPAHCSGLPASGSARPVGNTEILCPVVPVWHNFGEAALARNQVGSLQRYEVCFWGIVSYPLATGSGCWTWCPCPTFCWQSMERPQTELMPAPPPPRPLSFLSTWSANERNGSFLKKYIFKSIFHKKMKRKPAALRTAEHFTATHLLLPRKRPVRGCASRHCRDAGGTGTPLPRARRAGKSLRSRQGWPRCPAPSPRPRKVNR